MKRFLYWIFAIICMSQLSFAAELKKKASKLDSDPEVLYMDQNFTKKIQLLVLKHSQVYRDKEGKSRLGILLGQQKVTLEAMTAKAYRVRGKGKHGGIAGWVNPKAFAAKDPEFIKNLKAVYKRQMEVNKLIEENDVAIGMTSDEVKKSLGKPTKQKKRVTKKGTTSVWDFTTYDEEKHYTYVKNARTGALYRQLSHVTRVETGKITVEFEDGVVTALEEKEQEGGGGDVKVIIPPIVLAF